MDLENVSLNTVASGKPQVASGKWQILVIAVVTPDDLQMAGVFYLNCVTVRFSRKAVMFEVKKGGK